MLATSRPKTLQFCGVARRIERGLEARGADFAALRAHRGLNGTHSLRRSDFRV
jgi:hypothetical protein